MCGITGIVNLAEGEPPSETSLRRMLASIRHRGPDEFGIFLDSRAGIGNARLSIIDLHGGQQPICNEDETLWIVFNGEIFNYIELRPELVARGHRFTTHSDTEVLLHLYEEHGPQCLNRLNGQFAFAIWNTKDQTLFAARDRLGIRPLFYTLTGKTLIFASEIKAILTDPRLQAVIDPITLDQIFTFWSPLSPRTIFKEIWELPPGHWLKTTFSGIDIQRYWEIDYRTSHSPAASPIEEPSEESYLEEFENLLMDALTIRLRADVPVGAYLSGGLDSSIIASIISSNHSRNHLDTFSVAFSDAGFDESLYQRQMAEFIGTDHQVVHATHEDIGRVFPDVVRHIESPIMRTAPAPMFLLSELVRKCGYKVVLTGEGADEIMAGYDIFKEAKIRRFWARQPESKWRPQLFQRLYADISSLQESGPAFIAEFFRNGLAESGHPAYSHLIRWRNNRRTCRFFSQALLSDLAKNTPSIAQVSYPPQFASWGPLERAQYLETTIFLSQYLLSYQGDRVAMAHSVEGRFPFLDYRLVEFCSHLPAHVKLRNLTDKYLLRQLGSKWIPREICQRPKRPYRAPIHKSFFNETKLDYVWDLLSPQKLNDTAIFNPAAVSRLVRKSQQAHTLSETDDMALVGVLSTQLVHHHFIDAFNPPPALSANEPVKVRYGAS